MKLTEVFILKEIGFSGKRGDKSNPYREKEFIFPSIKNTDFQKQNPNDYQPNSLTTPKKGDTDPKVYISNVMSGYGLKPEQEPFLELVYKWYQQEKEVYRNTGGRGIHIQKWLSDNAAKLKSIISKLDSDPSLLDKLSQAKNIHFAK